MCFSKLLQIKCLSLLIVLVALTAGAWAWEPPEDNLPIPTSPILSPLNLSVGGGGTEPEPEPMADPAFRAISAGVNAASGNINIAMPTGTVENDVMIAQVLTYDNVACTFPEGWTIIHEVNNGANARYTIAWKRAASDEAGPYTVTHTAGSYIIGRISSYSGCKTTDSPINTSSLLAEASGSTINTTAIVPDVNGCLIVFLPGISLWATWNDNSSGGGLSWTERGQYTDTYNTFATATALQTTAASIAPTGTFDDSGLRFGVAIALSPVPATPNVDQKSFRFFAGSGALPTPLVSPNVEAADFATSGNNTAATAPGVAYPAYVSGDLLVAFLMIDNSAAVDITPPAAGPHGEARTIIGNLADADQGMAAMWWIGDDTMSASTQEWTISGAGESWVGRTFRVPAGEFNPSDPIDSVGTIANNASDATPPTPSWTCTDANAKVLVAIATDAVNVTGIASGWALLSGQDIGAVAGYVAQRTAVTTASETIASVDFTLASADTSTVIGIAINAKAAAGRSPQAAAGADVELEVDTDYGWQFRIENSGGATTEDTYKVQYKLNEGSWTDVSDSSDVIVASATGDFANGADVPEYITGTGTYVTNNNAALDTTGSLTLAAVLGASSAFEGHLNFQVVGTDVADEDTIQLRVVEEDGSALDTYTDTPTITVNKAGGGTTTLPPKAMFDRRQRLN